MIIKNQLVEIKWHPRNYKHYIELGYKYTGIGTSLFVPIEHIMLSSKAYIDIKCDYCGKIFKRNIDNHFRQAYPEFGDCCYECHHKKVELINFHKYGVKNQFSRQEIEEKIKQYFLEVYGVENISQSEYYKSIGVHEKAKKTNLERYGVEDFTSSKQYQYMLPQILRKRNETLYKLGNGPCSKQQYQIYEMLKRIYGECFLNFPCDYYLLDCVVSVDGIKIDIEYDCIYWHKDKRKDAIRDSYVKKQGYKVLRIKANIKVPTDKQLLDAINILVNSEKDFYRIKLDV